MNLMAKDQSNKSLARSSYEKISKATFGPFRRISQCPKKTTIPNPSLSATDTPPPNPSLALHQHEVVQNQIPCESPTPPPEVKKKFVRFSSSNIKKCRDDGGKELTSQKTFSEENYNGYIDRTKMKMRAPSNVSGGRTVSRRESFNDLFSSYISRTKFRLRTTSTVGTDGKTVSSE